MSVVAVLDLRTDGISSCLALNGPVREKVPQIDLERPEVSDLIFNAIEMLPEQLLDGATRGLAAIINGEDIPDFLQGEPEALCLCNEADSLRRAAIINTITTVGSPRTRQQPNRFVVP